MTAGYGSVRDEIFGIARQAVETSVGPVSVRHIRSLVDPVLDREQLPLEVRNGLYSGLMRRLKGVQNIWRNGDVFIRMPAYLRLVETSSPASVAFWIVAAYRQVTMSVLSDVVANAPLKGRITPEEVRAAVPGLMAATWLQQTDDRLMLTDIGDLLVLWFDQDKQAEILDSIVVRVIFDEAATSVESLAAWLVDLTGRMFAETPEAALEILRPVLDEMDRQVGEIDIAPRELRLPSPLDTAMLGVLILTLLDLDIGEWMSVRRFAALALQDDEATGNEPLVYGAVQTLLDAGLIQQRDPDAADEEVRLVVHPVRLGTYTDIAHMILVRKDGDRIISIPVDLDPGKEELVVVRKLEEN